MQGKMRIREALFIFVCMAMTAAPFLTLVRLNGTLGGHTDSKSYSLFDVRFGYIIIILSLAATILFIFKSKLKASCIIQIINAVTYIIAGYFTVDYYHAVATNEKLLFWFASMTDMKYSATSETLPGYYIGIGISVFTIIISAACLLIPKDE
ncbi:MAG: hypothetical protein J5685_00190 [Clostridiales bacterium]|nr:hypothetical protein [Clostridiales bacterium]